MEAFKLRLLEEAKELKNKINKLHDFLYSQDFMNISQKQKNLLREQYKIMNLYYNILDLRINDILTDEDKKGIKNGNS